MSISALSSEEKVARMNKEVDPTLMNNGDTMRNLGSGTGTKVYPSPVTIVSTEVKTEKSSRRKKKTDAASKDGAATSESWPCPGSQFIPANSPRLITISEATSRTTSTSSSAMITPLGMKLRDLKVSVYGHKVGQDSFDSSQSDHSEGGIAAPIKRHTGGNSRWESIQYVNSRDPPISLNHFKLLKRIGYGDIGSVYLVELKGTNTVFAMKVMDRASLVSRNKLLRAQTEREILSLLDHPFLPTLYTHFETEKYCCLVMEYCSGGNLHSLRQKQPNKYFSEKNARFYATEVLLAIEYLHMLGIVYRDLKPENVLVRDEGHIMLSDFDLSLQCSVNPTLVNSSSILGTTGRSVDVEALQGCMKPKSFFPRILPKKNHKNKVDLSSGSKTLPELMAEPTSARSMSFVGTHEYLAPEIIRGEGHGSAVDWWTFGIFLYELMYGTTPFKGSGNRATLFNVIGQPLMFPEVPNVSPFAKELINGLLVKEPQKRIGYRRGATEIKQHAFFDGVNWALVRSATPPHIPEAVNVEELLHKELLKAGKKETKGVNGKTKDDNLNFDFF